MDGEKQDNPENLLHPNKDNLLDDAQRSTTEKVVREGNNSKTIQHLLSDWRTAIASHSKIKQPGGQRDDQRRNCSKIKGVEQSSVFASQDTRQKKKIISNKQNQEFRFMYEEVKIIIFFIYLFIKYWFRYLAYPCLLNQSPSLLP